MLGLFSICCRVRLTLKTSLSQSTAPKKIGEISTFLPLSQPPVSATRYLIVHLSSSKKNSTTPPISPSLAPIEKFFRLSTRLNMLHFVQRLRGVTRSVQRRCQDSQSLLPGLERVRYSGYGPWVGHAWNCLCVENATNQRSCISGSIADLTFFRMRSNQSHQK